MAKIKYNVKGVERGGGNYEQPKPGLYEMEIVEATHRDKDGKNDIEVILEVTKNNDAFVGSRVWTYVGLGEASAWKMGELVDALGLPEEGALESGKDGKVKALIGKKMKVKINADSYNDEYRARAGRFAPLNAEAAEASTDEDPDADPDPDDPDAGEVEGVVEVNGVELSTDPSYYDDWSDDDTFEEIENQSLELGRKKKTKANVVALLVEKAREALGGGDGGGSSEDETAAAADDGDNYDDEEAWSNADLAAEFKKRELTLEGKANREKIIAALRADDAGGADDDPFADL